MLLDIIGYVNQCDDVYRKLAEDRANDVGIEDVGLGSLFRKAFDGL